MIHVRWDLRMSSLIYHVGDRYSCHYVELSEECCLNLWHQKLTSVDVQCDAGEPNIH